MSKGVYEALVYLYTTDGPTLISSGLRLDDSIEIVIEVPGAEIKEELDRIKEIVEG